MFPLSDSAALSSHIRRATADIHGISTRTLSAGGPTCDSDASPSLNAIRVVIGPVDGAAARVWIDNTRTILEAIRSHPEMLPFRVPAGVTDEFMGYLTEWRAAADNDEFLWEGQTDPAHMRMLLTYWVNIDRLTDRQLADLEVGWSPPAGEPFFHVLSAAIIAALLSNDELADFGENLSLLWS